MPAAPAAPAIRKWRRLIPLVSCSFISEVMITSSFLLKVPFLIRLAASLMRVTFQASGGTAY
jgi:hypothetical protein